MVTNIKYVVSFNFNPVGMNPPTWQYTAFVLWATRGSSSHDLIVYHDNDSITILAGIEDALPHMYRCFSPIALS